MSWFPHPTEIEYLQQENKLRMTFSDDHVAEYPTLYLRGYCPCAHCQGHGGGPAKWQNITQQRQITVEDISQVGAYAICIVWADGHDTGIYTFENLRKKCPCPKCLPEGLPAHEIQLNA